MQHSRNRLTCASSPTVVPSLTAFGMLLVLMVASLETLADEPAILSVQELAESAKQSIVVVSFTGRDGKQEGLGSGFVIDSNGLIATNMHVIGEARPISVQFQDGKSYPVTEIHASDRHQDLAILKIDAKNLPALPLGNSDDLKQGQEIVALGNPLGLKFSIVSGVVSGEREIDGKTMIQIAIPIERGNSGGPMLDRQGRVHGLLTMKSLVTQNLGFAVAINELKPLIEKPNPIPMTRWLTIGQLNSKQWTPLFGANWTQRAGRIHVSGSGEGFGGRSLCLSTKDVPEMPFELGVWVKLEEEAGAAGLVFHSNGEEKHYGFYPSNGELRFARFDGEDVFSWQVLEQRQSEHYRPGEWNHLKVRVEENRILCYLNDQQVMELQDGQYRSGKVGLAKFRDTVATFKGFEVGKTIASTRPDEKTLEAITKVVTGLPAQSPPRVEMAEKLLPHASATTQVLQERAAQLELEAQRLRELALTVHREQVQQKLAEILAEPEDKIDLLHAALLIAKLDNEELEVEAYLQQVEDMAAQVREQLPENPTSEQLLQALNKYLFEEMGFHGSRHDYYNKSNSYLNEVIDDREGLPITLSVLYMELGRRLGLNIVGVGLPGHFVVRHEPAEGEGQLIDPYGRGKLLSLDEARTLVVGTSGREFDEQYLAAITKKDIIVRMLTNLMGVARDSNNPEGMLRYVDTMLAIDTTSGQFYWYRAVLRFQTQRHEDALADIAWLEEHHPPEVDLELVHQLRAAIASQNSQK